MGKYASLYDLIEKELDTRGFKIQNIQNNKLIATCVSKNILRKKDSKIIALINKQGDEWTIDAPKEFYRNRVYIHLSKPKEIWFGKDGSPKGKDVYHICKIFNLSALEQGKYHKHLPGNILFPYSEKDLAFLVSKRFIKEYIEKGFETFFKGFDEEDKKIFGIPIYN